MDKQILYKVRSSTVFDNGQYEFGEKDCPMIGGRVSEYYDITSAQYNQLKAKLYNLVEASVTDEKQREALKGLIKGFCNTAFSNTIQDLDGLMERLGIHPIGMGQNTPRLAEPLESL